MNNKKLKVAIYCRTATKNKEKIQEQKSYLTNLCKLLGYNIVKVYEDNGFSGRDSNRPAYNQMKEDLESKKFNGILTISIDRISRDISEIEKFLKFIQKYDCTFKAVKDNIDFDTAVGKLFARIITFIDTLGAELENE